MVGQSDPGQDSKQCCVLDW